MGSVTTLGDSVCCPGDVTSNTTCPSFSESSKTAPPDTGTTDQAPLPTLGHNAVIAIAVIVTVIGVIVFVLAGYFTRLLLRTLRTGSGKVG